MSRVMLLKCGRIVSDEYIHDVLTEEAVSSVFDIPERLVESGGCSRSRGVNGSRQGGSKRIQGEKTGS